MREFSDYIPIPKRFTVKYTVNGEQFEEEFSILSATSDTRKIEAEINSEINDRFYWENRDLISYKRIPTPENMKIEGLEEYYSHENDFIF